MNRLRFTTLIIMMLLSIVGIIWVQIVWIKNAISIQNKSFNNAVAISLNNAAQGIEASRRMNFFSSFLMGEPSYFDEEGDISGYMSIESYSSGVGDKMSVNILNQTFSGNSDSAMVTTRNRSYIIDGDSSIVSDSVSQFIASPDESGRITFYQNDISNPDSSTVYSRQNEFLDWLRRRAYEFRNLSDQRIADIYAWEKTLELDKGEIENAIRKSLYYTQIETPFEYAIIKNGVLQDGSWSRADENDFLRSNYKVRLFSDNIINQDIILSVVFPEKTNYMLGYMGWILGGSLIFSLFILTTFAFSLWFIFRQKKISEVKSDFLNNMTHEFKTPIATISLAADTITNPKIINNEDKIRHFVGMIKKENSRMNKKVETILQIASLDKKEMDFQFRTVSLHTIINHSVETIEIQVQQRDGRIILNLNAKNHEILGDYDHLTNLVNNFLDNALKYSFDAPEITVATKNVNKGIILSFEDKGIGMTKAVQSKIFERFYRQASGNVHDVKGFGLGLNYARAIIDAHKGNVTVTSEPGKGSRFDIFLPLNLENQ
ncbi:MAG TPA: HAMP domain-containing sensor histidine kinase [Bacteroidales bacterium]|nr:HAMP domain-containing sensor histidine kinase [Bacteroidales bacterium]